MLDMTHLPIPEKDIFTECITRRVYARVSDSSVARKLLDGLQL